MTGPHFRDLREQASSFEHVAVVYNYSESGLDLALDGQGQRLRVLPVTADYFRTLRAGAVRGPGFSVGDAGGPEIILSDALWAMLACALRALPVNGPGVARQ